METTYTEEQKLKLDTHGGTHMSTNTLTQNNGHASFAQSMLSQDKLESILAELVPQEDKNFYIDNNKQQLLEAISALREEGKTPNILLTGETGTGKTSLAYNFAAQKGLPLLKMNCPLVREPRDWMGQKTVVDSTVHWIPSLFAQVIERGHAVILLDEISRATPVVLNTLMPLLDHTRSTYVEEIKSTVSVGENLYFFATANVGGRYTGTWRLDSALASRFGITIECNFPPHDEEVNLLVNRTNIEQEKADKLVSVAGLIRQQESDYGGQLSETLSTRTLLEAASLYTKIGADAFLYTILPLFEGDGSENDERATVIQYLQSQFGMELNQGNFQEVQEKSTDDMTDKEEEKASTDPEDGDIEEYIYNFESD